MDYFYEKAHWKLQFNWLPRRCCKTNKLLWFAHAYKGTAVYTGPGTPAYEHRWMEPKTFIYLTLRGEV